MDTFKYLSELIATISPVHVFSLTIAFYTGRILPELMVSLVSYTTYQVSLLIRHITSFPGDQK